MEKSFEENKGNQKNKTRDNELFSSLSHFSGFLISIAGLVLLIVFGSLYGEVGHIVGFTIFGSGLILLYLSSAIYHFISKSHPAKRIFQKIDHAMIYFLIASTYTPLSLVIPNRGLGWTLFGVIWGVAVVGILLKIFYKNEKKWLASVLYLFMGWFILGFLPTLKLLMTPAALWWLAIGGVFYTLGVVFFTLERKFPRKSWLGLHEIFHLFVMAGSFSHFWFMFKYVLQI